MIYTYEHQGTTYTINLERQPDGSYLAQIDGRDYQVQANAAPDGGLLLQIDGKPHTAYVSTQNHVRFIHINGQTHTLSVPESQARRRSTGSSGGLTAQMPGQVIEVLVNEGDAVQSGQTLVILEAMKMEIRVSAPHDGIVRQVGVRVGDVVDRGQKLVEVG